MHTYTLMAEDCTLQPPDHPFDSLPSHTCHCHRPCLPHSRVYQQGKSQFSTRTLGTISHMSPELLRQGKQSLAADVYAFGIVMWEVVVGRAPYGDAHYGAVFERVAIDGERPELDPELEGMVGEEYMLLMQRCWHADAAMRPTFGQVHEALEILLGQFELDVVGGPVGDLGCSKPGNGVGSCGVGQGHGAQNGAGHEKAGHCQGGALCTGGVACAEHAALKRAGSGHAVFKRAGSGAGVLPVSVNGTSGSLPGSSANAAQQGGEMRPLSVQHAAGQSTGTPFMGEWDLGRAF